MKEVYEYGYAVPFLQSLEQLLNIKCVRDAVLLNFESNSLSLSDSFADVFDGDHIKSNPVYVAHEGRVLVFQIYSDEMDPGNTLGSKKGKNKVTVFYWVILNLPPDARSSLRAINLLAIVESDKLAKYGSEALLEPFLRDLRRLQHGVRLNVRNDTDRIWYGILLNVAGDMPASNQLGGFKISVGPATSPCRCCHIVKGEMDHIHHESLCKMRDKESHERHVNHLSVLAETSKSAKESFSTQMGINGPCFLSTLDYFDPTKCFPHDVMHLVYEGILNKECMLLLNYMTIQKGLDLDRLNDKIASLRGAREFTSPPAIRADEVHEMKGKLSFSSSEMSSLATVLPLFLGDILSSESDPRYENFLLLLEIIASLQCYTFTHEEINCLQFDIETHNMNYVKLYPNPNGAITPKLHALLHLPSQIRAFGPPRYAWCFRYESANVPLKKVMRRTSNFHGIPFSMAMQRQRLTGLAIRTEGGQDYFSVGVQVVSGISYPVMASQTPWYHVLLISEDLSKHFEKDVNIWEIRTVRIAGRLCQSGAVFLKEPPSFESLPKFCRIVSMYSLDNQREPFFIMEDLNTLFFTRNHFSFVVQPTAPQSTVFYAVNCAKMRYNVPLHSFLLKDVIHVCPNYYHLL